MATASTDLDYYLSISIAYGIRKIINEMLKFLS